MRFAQVIAMQDEVIEMQQAVDPRVADLIGAATVMVGTFRPQCLKDPETGRLGGWPIELAHALAARIGVEATLFEYSGPDELLAALTSRECDVGFLPDSPDWKDLAEFSRPFLQIDFTFLAPSGGPISRVEDVDLRDVRIVVVKNHASTLALKRILKNAKLIEAETTDGALDILRSGNADLFASTRPQLIDDSNKLPGSIVLKDRYGFNFMTIVVPRGQGGRLAYMNEFLLFARQSGLLYKAVERSGWAGVDIVSCSSL